MKLDLERDFAENTTLHGISRVFQSAGVVLKLFWSIIFLSAFGLFIWQFTDRITAYLKFDVNTLVEVKRKVSLPFPLVSLCNYNRFWSSRITDKDQKHLDTLLGFADADYYNYYSQNSWGNYENYSFFEDEDFNFEDFARESGFTLKHSLLRCDWKGKKNSCSANNFTGYVIPEYGICYTFGDNISPELSQNLPGSGGGLSILLDIDQEFYTETFKQGHHEAGLKFVVHDKNDPPLVDTLGLAVPPGFHTYVALRQTAFELLPEPWGECKTAEEGDSYSRANCLLKCRLDFIVDKCHCRPLGYVDDIPLCTPDVSVNCVGKAVQEYRSAVNRKCDCPSPCTEISYKSTLSMTVFPSDQLLTDYLQDFPYIFGNKTNGTTDQIRKNLVYLDIFFDELSETKFKQVPAMTWSALLSDLGGQMGLFLGMSAITAAEVMEYVIRKIYSLLRGNQPSTRVTDTSSA